MAHADSMDADMEAFLAIKGLLPIIMCSTTRPYYENAFCIKSIASLDPDLSVRLQ